MDRTSFDFPNMILFPDGPSTLGMKVKVLSAITSTSSLVQNASLPPGMLVDICGGIVNVISDNQPGRVFCLMSLDFAHGKVMYRVTSTARPRGG
jgi:hypothetical protein